MRNSKKREYSGGLTILLTISLFLAFIILGPATIRAEGNKGEKDKSRTFQTPTEDENGIRGEFKRFQIEFYGGFTPLSPTDLNLFADYEDKIQEFTYDDYFDYLESQGQIRSWTQTRDGERGKIKKALPLGMRLRYRLSRMLTVSVGFRYLSAKNESEIDSKYTRYEPNDEQYIESLMFTPFSLSAKAYTPQIGIHFTKTIKKALTLEGFLAAGPLFVQCRYLSDWSYVWRVQGSGYEYIAFSRAGLLEAKGSGTGIALDLGGRLDYAFVKNLSVFLEGSYAYQAAKNVSGPGFEVQDDMSASWDGQWSIKQEKMSTPWGEQVAEMPTNFWSEDSSASRRDFKLDLSAFQLKLGFSFRF